jgi:phosphoserine phosphatase RsbU/P
VRICGKHFLAIIKLGAKMIILFFLMLSIIIGLSIFIYIFKKEHKKTLKFIKIAEAKTSRDLDMARRIQSGLLAKDSFSYKKYQISAYCQPAEKIGGDFFLIKQNQNLSFNKQESKPGIIRFDEKKDNYINVIIGDVSGHGIASALVMVLAKDSFEDLANKENSPAEIFAEINQKLIEYTENSDISFVTAFYALIDPDKNELIYSKAGHTAPIVLKENGDALSLDTDGVFLGMFDNQTYEEKRIPLDSGDKIFLYTDGLTEAKNVNGELLGTKRLTNILKNNYANKGKQFLSSILEEIESYSTEKLNDDATMVLIEVT